MVPIENSLEGSVGQNYDLLTESSLGVCGETILRVEHCLIANPGVEMKDLKKVYSHPQAIGQCRKFIEENRLEAIPVYDTAGSVKQVKESGERDAAGIASELAARIYGMSIIKKNIETDNNNFTRFFAISRSPKVPRREKTSITFMLKHEPGSLFKALGGFSSSGINLTKLESRPIIGKPWEYRFYVDFEGDSEDPKVRNALGELGRLSDSLKIIGSYPKAGGTFLVAQGPEARSSDLFGKRRVAVIGAAGGMGKWFCRLFASEGFEVVVSGRMKTKLEKLRKEVRVEIAKSNADAAERADIVFISVLFSSFEDVIREIAPFSKGKIVIDLTSTKGEPIAIMHRHLKGARVLGTHPLFGPKADDTNQNFILTPTDAAEEEIAEGFGRWLEERGFHVSRMNPEKHDEIMSIALALSHFVGIAVGETWMEFDFGELRKAMPSSFKRLLGLVENISESDPDFYANLQVILPHVVSAEEKFVRNAQRLQEIVKMRDEKGFAREMRRLSDQVHAAELADGKQS